MLNHPVIMACTDFSPHSDITLRMADKICKATKGKLYVAHVSEVINQLDISPHTIGVTLDQQMISDVVNRNVNDKLRNQITGLEINAEAIFALGVPSTGILNLIQEKGVNLLVMGHGGAGALERLLLGGLTQKMIRNSPVPVWVVKKETHINKIIGLVDDSDVMDEVINTSEELSYLLDSDLEIVSVWQDYPLAFSSYASEYATLYASSTQAEKDKVVRDIRQKIQDKLSDENKTKLRVSVTQEIKVANALVEILNEDHANLAIMGSHSKNFFERILLGSETKRVLELFDGNIIVLPPKNES